jgi:DNA-binding MarR family transcriptional regulator
MNTEKNNPQSVELGGNGQAIEWPYEVLQRFRLIFKAVQQHSQWVETRCGVTSAQLWLMWELTNKPGMTVSELAKAMSIHQSTVSNLLVKLTKKQLVKRDRIHQDQRVVTVTLTDEGQALIQKAPSPQKGILQHALFQVSEDSLQSLAGGLDQLIKAMEITNDEAAMQPLNHGGSRRPN